MRPRKTHTRPTDAEIEILNILWATGPSTVRCVHEKISETKASKYTTTLKLMQIMVTKGQLHRDESERSHVYVPAFAREHAQQQIATDLMERAFSGSLRSLVLGALGGRRATREELEELKALIDEHDSQKRSETNKKGRTR